MKKVGLAFIIYLSHLFVGGEKLLVSGILEFVLLEVSPKFLDAFSTASLFQK